jgi:hypothetical protein
MTPDTTPTTPAAPPEIDQRMVPVYQISWLLDTSPEDPGSTPEELDTAYYALQHADQVWPHVQRWLDERTGSYVLVALEEIPLEEWVSDYSGDPEDAEP